MRLDEQLRAALDQEAEMQPPTRPDIEGLISGGQARRRHRTTTRIGIGAAAAVLVGGGMYGVTQNDRSDAGPQPGFADEPTPSSESTTTPPSYRDLDADLPEPGTYRKTVGLDASPGPPIEADLTFEDPGWYSGSQPVIFDDDASSSAGLGVFEAQALPGRSGCSDWSAENPTFREAATTPEALGRQLATLPSSTVVQPLTPTVAFGYDARHLRLRIDTDCPPDEFYTVADADTGSLGITYNAPWKVVVDFLVVDVDGTAIVVALWHDAHAPTELVEQATRVRESLSFVPREPAS